MKKISIILIAVICSTNTNAQLESLTGTAEPIEKKETPITPLINKNKLVNKKDEPNSVLLVGSRMDPSKGGNVLLPQTKINKRNSVSNNTDQSTIIKKGSYVGSTGTLLFLPTSENKKNELVKNNSVKNTTNIIGLNDNTNSAVDNTNLNGSLPSLTDDNTNSVKIIANTSNNISQLNNQLAPLTDYSVKSTNQQIVTSSIQRNIETVAPSLMYPKKSSNQIIQNLGNNNTTTTVSKFMMPELTPIEGLTANKLKNKIASGMPELAPIDEKNKNLSNNLMNGMPELAALELQGKNQNAATFGMPELAPIETTSNSTTNNENRIPELAAIENNYQPTSLQKSNSKPNKGLRGLTLTPGTLLNANSKLSYIFQPTDMSIEEITENKKEIKEEVIRYKPSAGGGMGLGNYEPEMYETLKVQVQQPQQLSQQQLQQAAKTHQHDPNNPCCKVQMYKGTSTKLVAKKPVYHRKKIYRQPVQQQIEYVYEQEPQQPIERIVYVPVPQKKIQTVERIVYIPNQVKQQQVVPQKNYQQEPQQIIKEDSRVVYRDYTNAYAKVKPTSNNCNCPNTTQPQAKDGKKYYSSANYSPNLVSGPTSGDYPVAGRTSDIDMKYSFYINGRGKYSVGLYNEYCSILLSQNGQVKEYKVNGDPNSDPNSYKPRLNYFGSPETIAGIPIEYNYNRSVHKIGSIQFEYDFEGFFKTVGQSQVLYTSRSSLSNVDGVRVNYDAMGNVTNVDQNNGLIQYNQDNNQSGRR